MLAAAGKVISAELFYYNSAFCLPVGIRNISGAVFVHKSIMIAIVQSCYSAVAVHCQPRLGYFGKRACGPGTGKYAEACTIIIYVDP